MSANATDFALCALLHFVLSETNVALSKTNVGLSTMHVALCTLSVSSEKFETAMLHARFEFCREYNAIQCKYESGSLQNYTQSILGYSKRRRIDVSGLVLTFTVLKHVRAFSLARCTTIADVIRTLLRQRQNRIYFNWQLDKRWLLALFLIIFRHTTCWLYKFGKFYLNEIRENFPTF